MIDDSAIKLIRQERGWKSYSDVGAERPSHVNAD
jgi:hypothetical protein